MSISLAIVSFFLSITLVIIIQKIFLHYKFKDQINNRSSHSVVATRSGGLAVFLVLFIISLICYVSENTIFDYSIIIPLSLLVLVGMYDDIYNVDFKLKFIFQIIAAKIILDNGFIIENLHGFLGIFELNRLIAQLFTIFIIVSIINAINFIDGVDGLAISILLFFIISFEFFANRPTPFINLSTIITTSILPLYYFNFKEKNKVFLGDSGSLFLGALASTYIIYILTNDYIIKPVFDVHKIFFVLSIFFYPILDLIRVVFIRIFMGASPFKADKRHIHHIILRLTNSHITTTLIIILMCLFVCILIQMIKV